MKGWITIYTISPEIRLELVSNLLPFFGRSVIAIMKPTLIAIAAVLLLAVGPVSAGRPFDGVTTWLAEHFKAAEASFSVTSATGLKTLM